MMQEELRGLLEGGEHDITLEELAATAADINSCTQVMLDDEEGEVLAEVYLQERTHFFKRLSQQYFLEIANAKDTPDKNLRDKTGNLRQEEQDQE